MPASPYEPKAENHRTDTSNFDTNLSSADNTVQKALDTLDDTAGGAGETNTASNTGSLGVGLFKQKTVADLEFYKIQSANNLLTAALFGTDYFLLAGIRDFVQSK